MLSRIVDAVGHETEALFDSGIRSGQDVLKAIALGAKGTMTAGHTYGLDNGEQGVTDALKIIHKELTTMGLCGRTHIEDIDQDILIIPDGFHRTFQKIKRYVLP